MTTDDIIKKEGKIFTNTADDKGGPTKFGITQKTLASYRGTVVTKEDVEALTEEEAKTIYQSEFIDKSPFRNLVPLFRDMLIDWSVTSGADDPSLAVQKLLNEYGAELEEDGVFGAKSTKAFNLFLQQWGNDYTFNKLIDARILFYIELAVKDSTQLKFLKGWVNRAISFRKY